MPLPTLVIVSGPAGSGKTTLAHRLAAKIGCPALCRDEIKEGMVAATPGFGSWSLRPLDGEELRSLFAAIRLFLEHGVTHVAEPAFQHANWERGLEPLRPLADLRIVRCQVALPIARPGQHSADKSNPPELHTTAGHFSVEPSFEPISLDAPILDVDTTNGYSPDLDTVVRFVFTHEAG
jgi:DNA polymerase III delta prime subunit